MVSNSSTGRELTASTWPSSSSRTWRELGSTSMRWNGSRGWATFSSSSSYQASKAAKSRITSPARSGSAGRKPAPGRTWPAALRSTASPAVLCTVNGIRGSSTRSAVTSASATPTSPPTTPAAAPAGTRSPRTSSTGTAYDGTIRLGSQTSTARVLSTIVSPPSTAWIRFAVGSCRSWPKPLAISSRT